MAAAAEGWHFAGHLWFFVHTSTLPGNRVPRELSKIRRARGERETEGTAEKREGKGGEFIGGQWRRP